MPAHSALTRSLLAGGIIAGAMLPIVLGVAGATRKGYSVWRNGVSQLGTGDGAWVFAVAFVLGGVLLGFFALGLHRVLGSGRGVTWGPLVIAVAAVGFIIGGLVPTDPALGYPLGAARRNACRADPPGRRHPPLRRHGRSSIHPRKTAPF